MIISNDLNNPKQPEHNPPIDVPNPDQEEYDPTQNPVDLPRDDNNLPEPYKPHVPSKLPGKDNLGQVKRHTL